MKAALLPIVLALSAGAAYAEGPLQGNEVFNFSPTLSRAEVQAQAVQSNRDGLVARGESTPVANTGATSGLSRAQVSAEAAEANRLGLVANGEIVPVFSAAQVEQVRMAGMRAAQGSPVAQSAAVTVTN